MNIFTLIGKNVKILSRNKISLLVILLGPLLIISLAGIAFNNTSEYSIFIGTHSKEYSPVANQFVEMLKENYAVTPFDTEEACINAVTIQGYHSCIIIPENLDIGTGKEITFYIDNSRANIASSIEQTIYQSLYNTTQQISADLTENLISTVILIEKEITTNMKITDEQKIKLKEIIDKTKNSDELLKGSNLEFNANDLQVSVLTQNANAIKNSLDTTNEIASDAIESFKDAITKIENISGSSSITEDAKEDIDAFEALLANQSSAKANVTKLAEVASALSKKIGELDKNLQTARTNTQSTTANLDSIQNDLNILTTQLTAIGESYTRILSSIESNKIRDAENIVIPVNIVKKPILAGSKINLLFPSLIILVVMLVSMMIASSQVIFEKTNKATKRMSMSPVRFSTLTASIFMTTLLITSIQIAIILVIMGIIFNIHAGILTIGILLLATIFFILLGMVIGFIFKTESGSMVGTLSVASIFFIISDLILPLESMGPKIMEIVSYFPFVLATNTLKNTLFFNPTFADISLAIYMLSGLSAYLIVVLASFRKKTPNIKKNK